MRPLREPILWAMCMIGCCFATCVAEAQSSNVQAGCQPGGADGMGCQPPRIVLHYSKPDVVCEQPCDRNCKDDHDCCYRAKKKKVGAAQVVTYGTIVAPVALGLQAVGAGQGVAAGQSVITEQALDLSVLRAAHEVSFHAHALSILQAAHDAQLQAASDSISAIKQNLPLRCGNGRKSGATAESAPPPESGETLEDQVRELRGRVDTLTGLVNEIIEKQNKIIANEAVMTEKLADLYKHAGSSK
jgi:hypothetical protein